MVYTIATQSNVIVNIDKSVYWKQILLALTASLPFFTFGVETNTLSSSAHSGHFIGSPSDVSWSTTALLLGSIVSPVLYCYSIDKFGRKLGIYAIYLTQGISLIPLLLEDNKINDIMLNALAGLSAGGLFTVLPIYVREITRNQLRGLNLSFMMLFTTAGYLMRIAIDLETMIYGMIAMVAFQFVSLLWLLETPGYLVKLKKFKEAHINFAAINCMDPDDEVVTCEINNLKSECERAKPKENLILIDIFRNQIWRDELKIGIVLQTCMVLCGNILFMDEDKSLSQLGPMTHPDGVLVVSSYFVGSAICFTVIIFLDRRYILTAGHSIMTLSMGVLAVFTQADLTVSSLRWLPVAALILLIIGYGFVWGLPVLVTVEMLNIEIRATVVSFIYVYSQILKLIHVHTFQYIEEYMGVYTIFYIFAGINLYGAVYSLFRIPVIKEKTVRQVEKQLKRIPIV